MCILLPLSLSEQQRQSVSKPTHRRNIRDTPHTQMVDQRVFADVPGKNAVAQMGLATSAVYSLIAFSSTSRTMLRRIP